MVITPNPYKISRILSNRLADGTLVGIFEVVFLTPVESKSDAGIKFIVIKKWLLPLIRKFAYASSVRHLKQTTLEEFQLNQLGNFLYIFNMDYQVLHGCGNLAGRVCLLVRYM